MKLKHQIAYMKCAMAFAECSNATRLKVGSVIVKNNRIISCGYNALPEHLHGSCELSDGSTDPRVRHSEKNALMGLIRCNESAKGAILFCTHAACELCAIDIADAGIAEFVYMHEYRCSKGIDFLKSAGIIVRQIQI